MYNFLFSPIPHCTENPIYVFPEMKLSGLVPNAHIHVSVSDLYIPRIGLPIWLQKKSQTDPGNPGNIEIAHRYMSVEIGRQNITIMFRNNDAPQFHFLEYISRTTPILTGPSFPVQSLRIKVKSISN
jgi:hypothetical protein